MKRTTALIIAAVITLALGTELFLGEQPGPLSRVWHLLRYFTILTNGLTAWILWREASGRQTSANWQATAVTSLILVGVIFQILLRPETPPTGVPFWTDLTYHALAPVAVTLWWLAYGARPLEVARLPYWLLWPTAYCIYVLTRAQFDGDYAYFFLDAARFGWSAVALNIAGLVLVFALTAAGVLGLSRLRRASV